MRVEFRVDENPDLEQRAIALLLLVLFVVSVGVGALAALGARAWTPGMAESLFGETPKGYWYLSRASGVVGYALLWYSMALGLLMTNRLARFWPGGPAAMDLHRHVGLLGLAFSLFHIFVLLGDPKVAFNIPLLLVPFAGLPHSPFWIALGQLGFYTMLIVIGSFYVRRWIGKRTWRVIHYANFLLFVLVLLHSVFTGPDSGQAWAQAMYWFTGGSILALTVYRMVTVRLRPARKRTTKRALERSDGTQKAQAIES